MSTYFNNTDLDQNHSVYLGLFKIVFLVFNFAIFKWVEVTELEVVYGT